MLFRGVSLAALALVGVSATACGTETFAARPTAIPIRTLVVEERELFAPAAPAECESTLRIEVVRSCAARCAPIEIARDGKRMASLLTRVIPEASPIPKTLRQPYARRREDTGRRYLDLPVSDAEVEVTGPCAYSLRSSSARVRVDGQTLRVDPSATRESMKVEVSCP